MSLLFDIVYIVTQESAKKVREESESVSFHSPIKP